MGARSRSTTGCSYAGHEFTLHTNQQHRTEGATQLRALGLRKWGSAAQHMNVAVAAFILPLLHDNVTNMAPFMPFRVILVIE